MRKLPSEKRNYDITTNIEFVKILSYPLKQNINAINSWVKEYEEKLTKFLQKKKGKIEKKNHSVYCQNINYLIDIIVRRIRMFYGIEKIKWEHDIEQISKSVLKDNTSLKCERNFHNHNNPYVYVKKMMYDLCEDIDYIMKDKKILYDDDCYKFIDRIKYRTDTLMQIYNSFIDGKIFIFDKDCTISYITKKLEELECKPKVEQTEAIPNNENTVLNPTETDAQETPEDEISGDAAQATDVENPESLSVELDLTEDSHTEPKLDTTYAAASLAGISLFGTILYKVKYHYINEILCTSFIFHVNIILI
ncbi:hypothetical protein PVNG_06158 [Plasmodium vivax North Korean]|uniref:Pv-fam-c protein n=1 Tax=Plasmodium vivax North Korean TaxID=1035514 RepID=A0A0J9W6I9_PLAVI|nr:hypothetical protein PVNG_06158 [Plasmodium vivax North Korean]